MPNTYTQIFIHIIFAVEHRQNLIAEQHRDEIEKYISGIINNHGHKLHAIYIMPDHCHILIGLDVTQSLSSLVGKIKSSSSKFINEKSWFMGKFNWQEGYGAFSYSKSQLPKVINYILNQEKHHSEMTFRDEYIEFLTNFKIDYDDRYLFDFRK
jgi:REP element-mobilizing transposase RayT